jgi:hypothetical protein
MYPPILAVGGLFLTTMLVFLVTGTVGYTDASRFTEMGQ